MELLGFRGVSTSQRQPFMHQPAHAPSAPNCTALHRITFYHPPTEVIQPHHNTLLFSSHIPLHPLLLHFRCMHPRSQASSRSSSCSSSSSSGFSSGPSVLSNDSHNSSHTGSPQNLSPRHGAAAADFPSAQLTAGSIIAALPASALQRDENPHAMSPGRPVPDASLPNARTAAALPMAHSTSAQTPKSSVEVAPSPPTPVPTNTAQASDPSSSTSPELEGLQGTSAGPCASPARNTTPSPKSESSSLNSSCHLSIPSLEGAPSPASPFTPGGTSWSAGPAAPQDLPALCPPPTYAVLTKPDAGVNGGAELASPPTFDLLSRGPRPTEDPSGRGSVDADDFLVRRAPRSARASGSIDTAAAFEVVPSTINLGEVLVESLAGSQFVISALEPVQFVILQDKDMQVHPIVDCRPCHWSNGKNRRFWRLFFCCCCCFRKKKHRKPAAYWCLSVFIGVFAVSHDGL